MEKVKTVQSGVFGRIKYILGKWSGIENNKIRK